MSDVPQARARLEALLRYDGLPPFVRKEIASIIPLLGRERPEFVTKVKLPPMTRDQVHMARKLRSDGLPLNEIARKLGTNIGRVSEAINGLREGI